MELFMKDFGMTTEGMDMEQLNGDMIVYIKQNGEMFNAYGVY